MQAHPDAFWLSQALQRAQQAKLAGEVPVGAVLVLNNEIIGEGYNCPIKNNDPSAHAEMIALRTGAEKISNYRLLNSTLYVTLEPCIMCAAAMVHARIQRLVFGAYDPKAGAVGSKLNILDLAWLNHKIDYLGGILETECREILTEFFREKRK